METKSACLVVSMACILGATLFPTSQALDNGLIVPPMGWSSWYGFTQNINETMLREMADGMVSSGLNSVGFEHIWIDDGWAIGRENKTGHVIVDPVLFPSGMRNLSDYLHSKGLKFGIYTSKGPLTCLGYQPTQPKRPGSCGYEQTDANTYALEWQVDAVKDDGCGACPQHEPFGAMRDALNKTGHRVWYAIHSQTLPGSPNATVANMWRTGGDLSQSSFAMWTNRLDLATTDTQRKLAGPGAFPNPDFLEVGYSPRNKITTAMNLVEQRSMFTMWAALPGPLILSADLRVGREGLDPQVLAILMNKEVIAVNQDARASPMMPVRRQDGIEVWRKPLSSTSGIADDTFAVLFFNRNISEQPLTRIGMGACSSTDVLKLSITQQGMLQLLSNSSLCIGSIGTCNCSNPPSPQLGIVACDINDRTQTGWSYDTKSKQLNHDSGHDLNSGPVCPGEAVNCMMIYPSQGHQNEQYIFDTNTGTIASADNANSCIVAGASGQGPARQVSVSWAELNLNSTQTVSVRDLWNQKDLGSFQNSFSATVGWHEVQIFKFKLN
eukprot:m.25051 g.25051  ORF g.25051 m.25051 type:complete len:553 (+) comp7669_c0_seq3:40-1698(+)